MLKNFAKERKKAIYATAGFILVILIIIFAFLIMTDNKVKEKPQQQAPNIQIYDDKKVEQSSFRTEYGERLADLEKQLSSIQQTLIVLAESNNAPKNPSITPPPATTGSDNNNFIIPPPPLPPEIGGTPATVHQEPAETVMTNVISMGKAPAPAKQSASADTKSSVKAKIPIGSFVKADLLTGVMAPTMGKGNNETVPVLMRITDLAILPNFAKSDIKDCFVIGDAKGNLAQETVSIRLSNISCVKSNGEAIEASASGYVSGSSGIEGINGHVVTKQGAMLGRVMLAGFIQGIANGLNTSAQNVAISPSGVVEITDPSKVFQSGLFSGAGEAAKRIADQYIAYADQLFPVIEVAPGQTVHLIFLSPVSFGG